MRNGRAAILEIGDEPGPTFSLRPPLIARHQFFEPVLHACSSALSCLFVPLLLFPDIVFASARRRPSISSGSADQQPVSPEFATSRLCAVGSSRTLAARILSGAIRNVGKYSITFITTWDSSR